MGRERSGKKGDDLSVRVPLGTLVYDEDTGELLGDLNRAGRPLLVAQGGRHGIGNTRFKSSTNRAPRKTTKGEAGEERALRLEMQVLADVGLLGMPNAGKSTLIRSVSAARPRVAEYPFTTLYPHLGVVRVGPEQSFVMADIPGLIEGASQGAGLGIRFLKHLSRTRLLLHMVDIGSCADVRQALSEVRAVARELRSFDRRLARRERWLVLNKIDLLAPEECAARRDAIVRALKWSAPVYAVSGATGQGCTQLMQAVAEWIGKENRAGGAAGAGAS
jgi:GTPase